MSSVWVRTWKRTPRIDCGLCRKPTCSGFSRALLVGDMEVDACPILGLPEFASARKELGANRTRRMESKPRIAPDRPKGGVLYTRPCKDADERLMAEFRVYNGIEAGEPVRFPEFDSAILCDVLECLSAPFEEVKCTRDLGYARIKASDMSTTVLQDGRVNMRRVESKDMVSELFQQIERVVISAVVCECCGCDLLSILSGCTKHEIDPSHPALDAGSSFSLHKDVARRSLTRGAFRAALGDSASEMIEMIDLLHRQLLWEMEVFLVGPRSDDSVDVDKKRARCIVVNALQSNECAGNETVVLKALSLLRIVFGGLAGINNILHLKKQLGEDQYRLVQSYVEQARGGVLTEVMPDGMNSALLLSYAHLNRVNRAIRLLNRWDH